jgi:hypothetical protein
MLREYFPGRIHDSLLVEGKTPDFAYIDPQTGLHIDIEIDEPYTPRQYPKEGNLNVTHCIGMDNERDSCFRKRGWIVLRFSEQQVIQYSKGCCKEVAKVISMLTGDKSVMRPFNDVQDVPKTLRWTEQKAIQMANRRERLDYRRKL